MVSITTPEQRRLLDEIHEFCRQYGTKYLIPVHKNYEQQMRTYEYQTVKVGELKITVCATHMLRNVMKHFQD